MDGSRFGFPTLFLFALLLGTASSAQAGTDFCSGYPVEGGTHVVDGNDPALTPLTLPSSIGIDADCAFRNFPISAKWPTGLTSTLNFKFDGYLATFNNVYYGGNMACAETTTKIWFVNSSQYASKNSCQDLFIPVESIAKQSPAATASVGVPFTYTLTIPVMFDPYSGTWYSYPSQNDLGNIKVTDDLTAAATGAEMTLVGINAYVKGGGAIAITNNGDSKHLNFTLPDIKAGSQVVVEVTVVLDNAPAVNTPGKQFTNTAQWEFSRYIDGRLYAPLPGQSGISQPMTIAAPNLVVNKTSTTTALNLGIWAPFTIDAQNTGGGDAWNVRIDDLLPDGATAGMCDIDPITAPGFGAKIVAADGTTVVKTLTQGTDYTATYSAAPTCQLSLTLTKDAGPIAPNQYLIITYQTQLDSGSKDNKALTNVAGATSWFSSDGSYPPSSFSRTLTDGTPGVSDFQDSQTVTTALHGYYFEKTVENLTTGANPAITALPGDKLRYKLRLFNVDQTIDGILISDTLAPSLFDTSAASFRMVTLPAGATYTFNSTTGLLTVTGSPLNIAQGQELVVEFEINLVSGLTNGTVVPNQASLTAGGGFAALSDDPYVNGVASPDKPNDEDPTVVTVQTPGPLSKANIQAGATIGERFKYLIKVPAVPVDVPLYDVKIQDVLSASTADMRFVSANVVSGGTWTLSNTGTPTSPVIQDTASGIDIPANGQAVIEVTVELLNTAKNNLGLKFSNTASYTYNRVNGINVPVPGGAGSTTDMSVIEPVLTATKTVGIVAPAGRPATGPAAVGDVLEYVVTIPNNGNSTAYDLNVADTLPAGVVLSTTFVPTAKVNGVSVTGFVATPADIGTAKAWGRDNSDGSLDIPAGQSLVLTYRATVTSVTGAPISNSVHVDWTSLQNAPSTEERTGVDCLAGTSGINDYCFGPATATLNTVDNTSITKAATADTYPESPASTGDPIIRVGDTVTYELTLNLQEYTTRNVVVTDVLPQGMALEGFSIDPGTTAFSYTPTAQPAPGATGTLTWNLGDITNAPSGNGTPIDKLVIRYVAKVVTDTAAGVGLQTSLLRDNTAKLSYTGGDPANPALTATERINVRQPLMSAISKVDQGTGRVGTGTATDPYRVSIAADVMKFQLQSCNNGLAPAYGVVITDTLASQLDETALATAPAVTINGSPSTAYTYTAPARGGEMKIVLNTAVEPGKCVTVNYDIGFHSDVAPNSTWSNQAQQSQYESLEVPSAGRLYTSAATAQVWMTNAFTAVPPLKTLVAPAGGEAVIGQDVTYEITVPRTPVNAALNAVVIDDPLDPRLEYVSFTQVSGPAVALVAGSNLQFSVAQIPAGRQVKIQVNARVKNDVATQAGSISNTVNYTYGGVAGGSSTAALRVVEPVVDVQKSVSPTTPPKAGDILTYTITLNASGGVAGDIYSIANDVRIVDTLGPGLGFVGGSTKVNGSPFGNPSLTVDPSGKQVLAWGWGADVVEGTALTLTYQVRVQSSVGAGQLLRNDVRVEWTSFNGVNAYERSGTGGVNDYFDTAFTELTTLVPGAPSKTALKPTATIGEHFTYHITVPSTPAATALYDVQIQDNLARTFSGADLKFVSAAKVSGSGTWTPVNLNTGIDKDTNLIIGDATNGIDIPAGEQAVIAVTIELLNTTGNNRGLSFTNTASNTYNIVNGDGTTGQSGGTSGAASMTVAEPAVSAATKTVRNVTAGKAAGDPAVGGDTLEYVVTVPNSGDATAYDVNIADTLPASVVLSTAFTPTAKINGVAVPLFKPAPTNIGGATVWGRQNGDGSLDIPANQSLVLTYRVTVASANGAPISNSAYVDWTSLQDAQVGIERTGANCPSIAAPDDYCFGPATATLNTVDSTSLTKRATADTYAESPASTGDPIVRVGDTVTYELTLNLNEGTTGNVVVEDQLPQGMALQSFSIDPGTTTFNYTMAAQPTAPSAAGAALRWEFGDITNVASNNGTPIDKLVIRYVAKVVIDPATVGVDFATSLLRDNLAKLSYTGGDPAIYPRLTATERINVRQPLMRAISKKDLGTGRVGTGIQSDPFKVNIATDVMKFQLSSCNDGLAPAYGVVINDTLASQLDETDLATAPPVVKIGATTLIAGTGYTYTAPARGGVMRFTLNAPVDPGQCVTVDYNIGFHTDVAPNQTWANQAELPQYASLPVDGRPYTSTATAQVWMTNAFTAVPPLKTLVAPASGEAVIGQDVAYRITVPGALANAALNNVVATDTLDPSLVFVNASATLNGVPLTLSTVQNGQALSWSLGNIPAGHQAVITLTARVANTGTTDAGDTFTNTASYTYTGAAQTLTSLPTAALTIVEPFVTVGKTVANATQPGMAPTAGDVLSYAVNLTATSGATRSGAFDTGLVDTLSLGLAYKPGTAVVGGVAVEPFVVGDGVTTAQTLTWAGIDIPEGATIAVTYDVRVQNSVVAGQTLSNSVTARWTSLDGNNAFERDGTGTPAYNDYFAMAATSLTTPPDATTLAKLRLSDTYNAADANLRVGDLVDYELRVGLQEGSHTGLVLKDTLPTGMVFENVVSANYFGTSTTAPTPTVNGQTVTWNLGDVVNATADNDPTNDYLVIVYRARVMNNDALAQQPTTQGLTNNATLDYTLGGVAATQLTASQTITVQQPMLALSKTAAPAGGDTVVSAGEVITYTVNIANSGAAPAYDTVLVDALPVGLRQGGVSVTSISLVNAGTSPPVLPPAYDPATGVATWNFDSGVADQYSIPAGDTLRVVYTVTADAKIGDALTLTNAATATLYYSFDDEAVPASGNASQREVYGPTNTAEATLTTPAPALLKANTQPTAAIGEQFKYRITVPATPVNTALHDVRILDDLSASAADLRFVSASVVSGGSWTLTNTSGSDTNLVIEDTASGINIPANGQAVIEITVELANTPTNVVGLAFTNTADYTYNHIANTPASQTAGRPGTTAPMQIAGLNAQKTVSIDVDNNSNGLVDPGDVLSYTLTVNNSGVVPATGVVLTDDVPANTTYVANSVTLNGASVPDSGVSPLASGMAINSAGSVSGTLAARSSAVVTFKVQVNAGVLPGTVISNQGYVTSNQLPTEPTDADGNLSNGYQPTTIVVGSNQQVVITKEVFVVGGGAVLPGSELEYVVRVSNTGVTNTTNLVITDDLASLAGRASYVAGSATLDGAAAGVSYAAPVLTADYAATYGDLLPGATATLRFRVLIVSGLATGTRLTNTAQMAWNNPVLTTTASASVDIGGVVGSAILNGQVWHDANFDNLHDASETNLAGWTVGLYRNNVQVTSVITDANGLYSFVGVEPTLTTSGQYELRFTAPGATTTTAKLGLAHSAFSGIVATDGMQQISGIAAVSGSNLQNLNLPIDPNGVVFDSIVRSPVGGATLTMLNNGTPVASSCFADPVQQNQVTLASGFYKFDLNYSDSSCPLGGAYVIRVTPPATGYLAGPSRIIPPVTSETTAAYDVASCLTDAVGTPAGFCEAQASQYAPGAAVPASQINHYLNLKLSNPLPNDSQLFNNHIAVDRTLETAFTITKTSSLVNVSRGQLVPYTITVNNTLGMDLTGMSVVDTFPPGFKYVEGSSRINGLAVEPVRTNRNLTWSNLPVANGTPLTIKLLFIVGSGVGEGDYVNRAQVFHPVLGAASGEATATVRVIPDPTFDCTDVIGKVFDDLNRNGYQDAGEKGLPGVRVATARGLLITTDEHGRFHVTCAVVPDENRGSNFILKVDDRTLPTGYRITTENPLVQRATRGKMMKFNFGAAIHKVVRIDVANGVFEPGTTEMRIQWKPRMDLLMGELKKGPSMLRLAYMAEIEDEKLVELRLKTLKQQMEKLWAQQNGRYELVIETEVFWRTGAPPSRSALK